MTRDNDHRIMPSSTGETLSRLKRVSALLTALCFISASGAFGQVPGGTLDPLDPVTPIPKYVTPLVIPPVMNDTNPTNGYQDKYEIAVRQFKQQILPGGIWNTVNGRNDMFPATTVWSYGPKSDPTPNSKALGGGRGIAPAPNSQFNYPAYTFEAEAYKSIGVRWINDLVNKRGKFLKHLLPVDQTLHWANPQKECRDGTTRTDCKGVDPTPYRGPVPIITHVHGSHVKPDSDGYPEAWFLPYASNIPAGYARSGTLFDDVTGTNTGNKGFADFSYQNDQPATTLWYHDHTLGMTRLNVYAGPAGFWLIRGGLNDLPYGLPGPAPVAGEDLATTNFPASLGGSREKYREIPIVIQDRAFNTDGSLFYPFDRAFFEADSDGIPLSDGQTPPRNARLNVPFAPDSDVASIWNPEAFFNVMVVNGVSWPSHEVYNALYRFRLLNGCNSRFLNLALEIVDSSDGSLIGTEIPFYQIGAEQGFLPSVVRIQTGEALELTGGTNPEPIIDPSDPTALLMGLAERADVIVDFRDLPVGTVVRMINTAPDAPFGGFPDDPANPETTGQVMEFVVGECLNTDTTCHSNTDPDGAYPAENPWALVLPAEASLTTLDKTRQVSLNELESEVVCVEIDGDENYVLDAMGKVQAVDCDPNDPNIVPFGPTEALLGLVNTDGTGIPLKWTDSTGDDIPINLNNGGMVTVRVTENPSLDATEEWDISNFTADAHPIHLHLVRFEVVSRRQLDGTPGSVGGPAPDGVQPWESGFKDTVIAYPGEITTVRAKFDIPGLYVWHCHIVEHEDNEMMRPFTVGGVPVLENEVIGFRLYDADSNKVIVDPPATDPLMSGVMLDIAGKNVNFEAITASPDDGTESVYLELIGPTSTSISERLAPYMLAGDNAGGGDIFPMTLVPGDYTLKATPYTEDFLGGTKGTTVAIHFTVNGMANNNVISRFELHRAGGALGTTFLRVLNPGDNVVLSEDCNGTVDGCNIEAVVPSPDGDTDRVRLRLDGTASQLLMGAAFRNEGNPPYFLGGDTGGTVDLLPLSTSYIGAGLTVGPHTVHAVPVDFGGNFGPVSSVPFTVSALLLP